MRKHVIFELFTEHFAAVTSNSSSSVTVSFYFTDFYQVRRIFKWKFESRVFICQAEQTRPLILLVPLRLLGVGYEGGQDDKVEEQQLHAGVGRNVMDHSVSLSTGNCVLGFITVDIISDVDSHNVGGCPGPD